MYYNQGLDDSWIKLQISDALFVPLTLSSLRVTYPFYSVLKAGQFYSSKGDPLGLKGLKTYPP